MTKRRDSSAGKSGCLVSSGSQVRLLLAAPFLALAACAAPHTVTKPVVIHDTTYVYKPLPAELTRACVIAPLQPACSRNGKPELCNDQLLFERNAYRTELAGCDADKTEIRKLQPKVTP